MKRKWFILFLLKSIARRKGRLIIASFCVTLAIAVVTGMIGITSGINEKLGSELKAYGANIIVSEQTGDYLDYDVLDIISHLPDVASVAGQVFGSTLSGNSAVEIIGLDIDRLRETGWKLSGAWPEKSHEILAGTNLREIFALEVGKTMYLESNGMSSSFFVSGFIERGGPEDSALIMGIDDAWNVTGLKDKLSAVLVRGQTDRLDSIVSEIRSTVPGSMVKTVRQVAVAEKALLNKIQLLMVLVTVVILFASAISITSTMGANVLERREEIAIMKAVGATAKEISLFYKAEASLIGVAGGCAGFVFGYIAAQIISRGAFNSSIEVPFYLFFISVLMGFILSVSASYFPVRDALKCSPAEILRGE